MVAARNPIEIGTTPEAPGATWSDITVNPGDVLRWVFVFAGATMVLTAALLALLVDGQARSSLLGGGIAFVANGYSVWRVFSVPADISGEATLVNLYRAEFGKLVITGALCATAFALVDQLAVGGFLAGLLATLLAATIGAIFAQRNDVGERPAG
jgi:F0F1-type ATP synthase assembly protein I